MKAFKSLTLTLCLLGVLVTPTIAADYEITLYILDVPINLYINHLGSNVASLDGVIVIPSTKDITITGTMVIEPGQYRFGLVLNNRMEGFAPVVWEFVIDPQTLDGYGNFQWLTDGEEAGALVISDEPIVTQGTPDLRALGIK
jgi:hypothetical protein